MFKRFMVTTLVVVMCFAAYAQNKGTVKGILKDSASKQILSLATVTIFEAKDTSIITYRLSDPTGVFQVPGIPFNLLCRVVITFQGYKTYRKEFTLTKEKPQLDLGLIYMSSDPHMLDDIVITAERPPVVVRNDTLEFNANAFKTLPSAVIEDLLKKLPGVDVDQDGTITVKGKRVNRLLVDGKEFFGGDTKIATRNLPANIVDKIQVTDDKEELESNPQMTKDEVGQVINIKLRKAIRQGWFGKAYAGGGTDDRHEAGGIVNIFRDTTQISFIGYSNNVNKPGFTVRDLQDFGGFNRSGTAGTNYRGNGGFEINRTSFGATGQGIQQSRGGGFNFNNQFGKKLTISLQYFYGQIESNYEQVSFSQRFFSDTVLTNPSSNRLNSMTRNHRIALSAIWKIDSLTDLTYRPDIGFTNRDSYSYSNSSLSNNYKGNINANDGINYGSGNGCNYYQSLSINRRFKKKGRLLNLTSGISTNSNDNDLFNDVVYTFYTNNIGKDSLLNQLRESDNSAIRGYVTLNFTEPLSKATSLIISNQVGYVGDNNTLNFFDMNRLSGKYDMFSERFSNGIEKAGWKNMFTATLSYRVKKLTLRPGFLVSSAKLQNDYTKNPDVKQHFTYVYPSLNIIWNSFNLGYRANVNEASASDLQEVIDISNPVYKRYGNPTLRPMQTHSFNLNYYKYSPKGNSFSGYINGTIEKNSVLRQTRLDSVGVEESRMININGVRSANANLFYTWQYKFKKTFRVSISPSAYGYLNQYFVSFNGGSIIKANNRYINGSLRVFFSYKDLLELNQSFSVSINSNRYEKNPRFKNLEYVTRYSQSSFVLRWPKHFVWDNSVNYSYNPRVGTGIRKTVVQWNAGASFLFLKDDKGQVRVSAYDLLNQNLNVYSSTYENYIYSSQVTTLHRYYLLSFIYTIRNFSGGKVGGKARTFGLF